ncbi:MAG: T9SS type A sorting domain-containing protein [Bacteroidia bacterium]|nr:T9SS type A sorting domain-containing protein [Bacteroidia bacterium]
MKNKKLLLIAFSVINFTLFTKAQQVDKLIIPVDGITMKFDQILDTLTVNNQGPWDFSKIKPTGSYEMSILPIKESQHASDYPNATHVLKSENGEFFWNYGKDGWYSMGRVTDNIEVSYEKGLQIFSYPFDHTFKHSQDLKTTHFFVPSKTQEPWQHKIEIEGVNFGSLTLPDGENYSDVLLATGKMTTIQGPHSILGVTLTLEEYFEQFWLGDYPLPIMENYYVISTSPTGTKKLEFKRTLFLSRSSMNTETKDQLGIDFYPNPTNSIVYFGSKQERVTIFDSKGSLIFSALDVQEIDVSNIPHGFYTVKLENEGNFSSHKLLKND